MRVLYLLFGCCGVGLGLGGGFVLGRSSGVLLGEALDASSGVDEFLLAGEEGMAIGADFDAQHVALHGRTSLEGVAAGAMHGDGVIVGVNTGFHEAPVCRGRSAQPLAGARTTGASLGHETIVDYTRGWEEVQMAADPGLGWFLEPCSGCGPVILAQHAAALQTGLC